MSIFKIKFILFSLQILPNLALNLSLQIWNLNVHKVNKTIEEAVKEYFETKTTILRVAIHLENYRHWEFVIKDYLSDVLKGTESMKFEIANNEYAREKLAAKHNLLYVDSYKAFGSLMPIMENALVERMGQYMVIMETAKHLRHDQELQLIFELAFQRNLVDIVVATYAANYTFTLYTYDIFHPQQCRQVVPRQFNTFQNGRFSSPELFPYKLRNFHKCPINIFIRSAKPFFGYNLTEDRKRMDHYWGLEAKIIRVMADKLNFDLRVYDRDEKLIGGVYDNGTFMGPFQAMHRGEIDIIMGYYNYPIRSRYFAVSTSYFLTPDVVVARKHHKVATEGMWLMEPYGKMVWLMIFLTIGIGMAIAIYINWKSKKRFTLYVTWLDIFGLALGNSPVFRFRSHFSMKCSFLLWTFGFMIICDTFHGKLYEAFNSKSVSSPISVRQLIEANYTFAIKRGVGEDLMQALQIPSQQIAYHEYSDDNDVYDNILNESRPVALLTNYWQFQDYLKHRRLYGDYDIVPRIVLMNQICAYMQPQSYLTEPLNRFFNSLNTGGILRKWILEVAAHFGTSNEIEILAKRKTASEPKPLSLSKVRIIFVGLVSLHVVSFVVFLGEILVKKISNK